ncbi:hypothetical protein ACJDU8_22630 [Clostridium sp. WILCCON 0269]|uniref:Uncharacterized protein n=1 Tax=Candidatus Clostridium eludens TaxID=3381663 RepID=A0ABW8STC4_9CLOT
MINEFNYEKSDDEEIDDAIQLVNAAAENYKNDNEIFDFECPICKGQAKSILYMFHGSLHGAVECTKCGAQIHI